jgi:carbamoyl-phosphate synthase large subunit
MKPMSILVTGVSAIISQGIARSLRQAGALPPVRVIGIDRNERSPGPSFCDAFHKKPDCDESHPDYLAFWDRVIEKEQVQLVLPGLEVDVDFLNPRRAFFAERGVALALNRPELIALSTDKWQQGEALQAAGLPRIPSLIPERWQQAVEALGPPPLLLKPRHGNGSRGIVRLHDETDFQYWRNKAGQHWMLQRIVGRDDEEYTVGVFGLGDGDALAPLVCRRRLAAAGNTLEAEVVNSPAVLAMSERLTRLFQPVGPTNYQFRVEADTVYLLEINPRFSSSNSLRTAFGFNEAAMAVDYFLHGRTPPAPTIRPGIGWRYSEDFVVHAQP